jgi:hypothetical protein
VKPPQADRFARERGRPYWGDAHRCGPVAGQKLIDVWMLRVKPRLVARYAESRRTVARIEFFADHTAFA